METNVDPLSCQDVKIQQKEAPRHYLTPGMVARMETNVGPLRPMLLGQRIKCLNFKDTLQKKKNTLPMGTLRKKKCS